MRQPEWDEGERAWMLGLALYRSSRCPNCDGDLAETTDEDNEDGYTSTSVRCHKCTQIARASKKLYDGEVEAPHTYLHRADLRPHRRG